MIVSDTIVCMCILQPLSRRSPPILCATSFALVQSNMATENAESTTEEVVQKTVLCVFMERKRSVTFNACNDAKVERKNLFDDVRVHFSDVLSYGEGSSASSGSYFLQTESSE